MFCFKILVVAAATQLVCAQQPGNLPEYVNVNVGEGGLYFIHPETPAGIGDGMCLSFLLF